MLLSLVWTLLTATPGDSPGSAPIAPLEGPHAPTGLFDSILLNFNLPGGLPGLSIASPSTSSPNYFYHWVRDGALNIDAVLNSLGSGAPSNKNALEQLVRSYFDSSAKLQAVPNLSGGVGEPKFHIDGSAFNGRWGRPQNDGPALRALVTCKWLRAADQGDIDSLWPFVYADLDYVARVWALPSFDLWEEVYGYHFFTSVCHYGALKAGALIALYAGQDKEVERFTNISEQIAQFIAANFLGDSLHVKEHFPSQGRGGLDAASVLAALELESLAKWTEEIDGKRLAFGVDHPAVLGTAEALIADMAKRYPINNGRAGGVGRYPEDVYDGYGTSVGNPWFITTAAMAEVLCRNGRHDEATAHLQFIVDHMGTTLSEQMDRTTGFMVGAANLTWSYCAVQRAFDAYAK